MLTCLWCSRTFTNSTTDRLLFFAHVAACRVSGDAVAAERDAALKRITELEHPAVSR